MNHDLSRVCDPFRDFLMCRLDTMPEWTFDFGSIVIRVNKFLNGHIVLEFTNWINLRIAMAGSTRLIRTNNSPSSILCESITCNMCVSILFWRHNLVQIVNGFMRVNMVPRLDENSFDFHWSDCRLHTRRKPLVMWVEVLL